MVFTEDSGEDLPWPLDEMLNDDDIPVGRMRDRWESEDEDFWPADRNTCFDIDPDTCLTEMATSEVANPEMVAPRTSFTTGRMSERTCRVSSRMSGLDPTSSNRSSFNRRSLRGMGSFRMRISQQHLLADEENMGDHANLLVARDGEAAPVVAGASSILRSILRNRNDDNGNDDRRLPDHFDFRSREPLDRNELYQSVTADRVHSLEDEPFPDDFLMGDFNGEYPTLLSHVSTRIHSADSLFSEKSSNCSWLEHGSLLDDDNAEMEAQNAASMRGVDGNTSSSCTWPTEFGDKVS